MRWPGCAVRSLKTSHLLLSLAFLPWVADHWSCPSNILKAQEKSIVEIMNMLIWGRKVTEQGEDTLLKSISLTQKQKYTPCFFQVHLDSADCCEAEGIFKYTYWGEFAKIPEELGRTLKRCWQLLRPQCSVH